MKIIASIKERWEVWVWQHTPHCTEILRLASQSLEQPLSLRTRLKMRLHFLICVWCERYDKQLKFLHRACSHASRRDETLPGRGLSAEARQRILQRLINADKKNL
jgi:hypothetical protein